MASPVTVVVGLVTGVVVAFVAAGTVFHVSASGSASVQHVNGNRCPDDTGAIVSMNYRWVDDAGRAPDPIGANLPQLLAGARRHGFDVVRRTRYAAEAVYSDQGRLKARLAARDGALERTRPLAGGGTGGAWVSDVTARDFGLGVGSVLTVPTAGGGAERVPVVAIYPAIEDPLDEFWCSQRSEVVPNPASVEEWPPRPILISPQLMDRLVGQGLTVGIDRLQATRAALPTDRAAAWEFAADVDAYRAEVLATLRPFTEAYPYYRLSLRVDDRAGYPARTAGRVQEAVGLSLLPLVGLSLLVGFGAVVGLARQWVLRRFAEVRLLWARGASPPSLGVKAVFELGVPLLVGCGLGWVLARLSVPVFAPAPQVDPWAPVAAGLAVAAVWVVCLLVLAAATVVTVRRQFQPRPAARRLGVVVGRVARWVPWEVVAAGLAVLSWRRLTGGALVVDPSDALPRVDVVALLFPLLCLLVLVGLAVRLLRLGVGLSHRLRGWRLPAVVWAVRRTAAQRRLAAALLVVAGLAVGAIAVGSGVADTERRAVLDKGRTFVGSDTAVRVVGSSPRTWVQLPTSLRGRATVVGIREGGIEGSGGGTGRVVVVDPATFADGVTWRQPWADADLRELLGRLGVAGPDGRAPVLQVGDVPPERIDIDRLPATHTVATVRTFPARAHAEALTVLSRDALTADQLAGFNQVVLARAEPAETVAALRSAGLTTFRADSGVQAVDALPFLAVAWTFDFFVTLGAVLAAVAAASLLVSIEARRRATVLATALLRRMGLRTRAVYASHAAELGALAVLAVAVGLATGWGVLELASAHFDPYPRLSPTPVPISLGPLAAVIVLAGALVVVTVSAIAVRSALRAPVGELLRA